MRKPMLPWLVAGLVLALGLVNPEDAGASGKMYWTDDITAKIQRANLDGSSVEDLVTTGLNAPQGIAVDPASGKMYWTDIATHKIQRANLDGSNVEDLVTTGLSGPFGIALDLPSPAPVPALGGWGTVLLCAALAAALLRRGRRLPAS